MASTNVAINVTGNAVQQLEKIQDKVSKLSIGFDKLKGALAGIAFANLISNTLKFADSIQDVSDATELAIASVVGFGTAVQANGGDAVKAEQGLNKFTQSVGDAKNGVDSAQKAFLAAGVSLQDLQTLSNQELFSKYIAGIGAFKDKSLQAANSSVILGKSMKGVNITGVASQLDAATASSVQYTSAILASASAQNTLERAAKTAQLELLKAIEPFAKAIGEIDDKQITILITGFSKLINLTTNLGTIANGIGTITIAIGKLSSAVEYLSNIKIPWWMEPNAAFGIVGAATSAAAKLSGIKLPGIGAAPPVDTSINDAETAKLKRYGEITKSNSEATALFAERQAKLRNEITKIGSQYATYNDEQLQNIALETRLVTKTDEQKQIISAVATLYKKQEDAIQSLIEKKKEWASGTVEQKANIGLIDLEISKIKELGAAQEINLTDYLTRLQSVNAIEKARLQNIENITKAIEDQISRQQNLGSILQGINDKKTDVQFETAQMARNPLEKQMAQIQEDARKGALEAGRSFAAGFEGMDLTADQAKELADGLDEIAKRYKTISDAQTKNLAISRSWAQGWKEASDQYLDNMTNAATKAGEMFNSITSNMNSAIDNFVDNGKFKFSDFAASIIKDLIKIELKASAAKMFSGAGGLFGGAAGGAAAGGGDMLSSVWDWGKSLLGFANGGMPPVNKPSIVGENGAEIFVPRTAGTILPNGTGLNSGQSNAPVSNTYITNNIQAVDAKSVAQLFAENRKTLFGTVEMARKEMSYGR